MIIENIGELQVVHKIGLTVFAITVKIGYEYQSTILCDVRNFGWQGTWQMAHCCIIHFS